MAPRLLSSRSDTCLSPLPPSVLDFALVVAAAAAAGALPKGERKNNPWSSASVPWPLLLRILGASGRLQEAQYIPHLCTPRLFFFVFFGWFFFVQGNCSSGAVRILVARFCCFVKESPGVSSAVDVLLTTA